MVCVHFLSFPEHHATEAVPAPLVLLDRAFGGACTLAGMPPWACERQDTLPRCLDCLGPWRCPDRDTTAVKVGACHPSAAARSCVAASSPSGVVSLAALRGTIARSPRFDCSAHRNPVREDLSSQRVKFSLYFEEAVVCARRG